jgi:hypothetical protein
VHLIARRNPPQPFQGRRLRERRRQIGRFGQADVGRYRGVDKRVHPRKTAGAGHFLQLIPTRADVAADKCIAARPRDAVAVGHEENR